MANHVAFFLPSLGGGGAERVLLHIANEFALRGHQVDLVVGDVSGPYRSEISSKVNVVPLNTKRAFYCLVPLAWYVWRRKPNAIMATMMHANVIASVACWITRSKARLILRESNVADVWNGKPLREGKSLLLRLATVFYPKANCVVAVSDGVKRSVSAALALPESSKPTVIYNPVISPELYRLASEPFDFKTLANPGVPIIVAVGRLVPVKDFATLLRAFALLRETAEYQLIIMGEGGERKTLENLAAELGVVDSVSMPGFVSNPFPIIAEASLCVSSSLAEGLPNVLIQALALGRRVVATDCPHGPDEILESGRWGELVPCGDAQLLSRAMEAALKNTNWQHPNDQWKQKYSVENIVNRYEQLVER